MPTEMFSTKSSSSLRSSKLDINVYGLGLVCLAPMLGGFLYGFDIGATSFVLSMLLTDKNNNGDALDWWADMTSVQQGLIVSALSLGALVGSHVIYCSHAHMGRRMELRICAALYLIGSIFNVLSGTVLQTSRIGFYVLFLGRLLFGVGVGYVMHGAPAYLAEMCPPQIRGAVVSAKETVIVGGIVFGYAAGNWMSIAGRSWSDLYGVSLLFSLPMLALTVVIPRSKRWLLLQHRLGSNRQNLKEEAFESMKFVYLKQDGLEEEFQYLVSQLERQDESSQQMKEYGATTTDIVENPCSLDSCCIEDDDTSSSPPSLWSPKYRNAVIPSFGLIILQQCSGQPSVLSYATVLFEAAGWSGNASVITAILMMATSMSTVLLVDRVGRKQLLCACCLIMMSASTTMAYSFWGWDSGDGTENTTIFDQQEQLTVLVAMFIYIGGYQVGFGPITWCIVSEIFPQEIRGPAIALGVELNYALNFLVQFLFPQLQESLGWGPSFGLFAIILGIAFWFIELKVPEMTGLSLEEIEQKLQMTEKNAVTKRSNSSKSLQANEKSPLVSLAV